MNIFTKALVIISVFGLAACGTNKSALKDASDGSYKQAKEAPVLIMPDEQKKK